MFDEFESIEWNGKKLDERDGVEENFADDFGQFME